MKLFLADVVVGRSALLHLLRLSAFLIGGFAFQMSAGQEMITSQHSARVIKRALPVYPTYAVKNRLQGTVLLNFSIEKDGNLSDIQVVASDLDGLFDATAILAAQKWLYTRPAEKVRNNYVAIEFVLTKNPNISQFSHVETIRVTAN